jgi:hypothetical protein
VRIRQHTRGRIAHDFCSTAEHPRPFSVSRESVHWPKSKSDFTLHSAGNTKAAELWIHPLGFLRVRQSGFNLAERLVRNQGSAAGVSHAGSIFIESKREGEGIFLSAARFGSLTAHLYAFATW